MDTSSWNDYIDYDEKLVTEDSEFWNVQMYFDGNDDLCYALSPEEVFCRYDSAQSAFENIRIITCEMTDKFGDEYKIEIIRIPPYNGNQIAYGLTDIDGELSYSWDDDNAYEISTLVYDVAVKALSDYFKKVKKWAVLAASDYRIKSFGTCKILSFSLWEKSEDNKLGILVDVSAEYATENAVMLISDVYLNGKTYILYYRWDDKMQIEARIDNIAVDIPDVQELVVILKTIIFELLINKKVGLLPD